MVRGTGIELNKEVSVRGKRHLLFLSERYRSVAFSDGLPERLRLVAIRVIA